MDGSFSGDKEMSSEEKCKVLPTLQLHLMYSPPLLSLLQPQCVCVCVRSCFGRVQLFCDPMDCSLPGSSVLRILRA